MLLTYWAGALQPTSTLACGGEADRKATGMRCLLASERLRAARNAANELVRRDCKRFTVEYIMTATYLNKRPVSPAVNRPPIAWDHCRQSTINQL